MGEAQQASFQTNMKKVYCIFMRDSIKVANILSLP